MSRIDILEYSAFQIQPAHPGGDEHFGIVVLAQRTVGLGEDFLNAPSAFGQILQEGFGPHHEEGSGNSLARHIGYQEHQMRLVGKIEVVEVSAHFFGRIHGSEDLKILAAGIGRKDRGKGGALNLTGKLQFPVNAAFRFGNIPLQGVNRGVDVV